MSILPLAVVNVNRDRYRRTRLNRVHQPNLLLGVELAQSIFLERIHFLTGNPPVLGGYCSVLNPPAWSDAQLFTYVSLEGDQTGTVRYDILPHSRIGDVLIDDRKTDARLTRVEDDLRQLRVDTDARLGRIDRRIDLIDLRLDRLLWRLVGFVGLTWLVAVIGSIWLRS